MTYPEWREQCSLGTRSGEQVGLQIPPGEGRHLGVPKVMGSSQGARRLAVNQDIAGSNPASPAKTGSTCCGEPIPEGRSSKSGPAEMGGGCGCAAEALRGRERILPPCFCQTGSAASSEGRSDGALVVVPARESSVNTAEGL